MKPALILILTSCCFFSYSQWELKSSKIVFTSKAPLESIVASTKNLQGLIDSSNNTFAFKVDIASLDGFNGPLQREHFNENYMESSKFPFAKFYGKFIDEISWSNVKYKIVRVKGILDIHGIKQERILRIILSIKDDVASFQSDFTIQLTDYNISIPRIVNQKIAEVINVRVEGSILK